MGGHGHFLTSLVIPEDVQDQRGKCLSDGILFDKHLGRSGANVDLAIGGLVIIGRVGVGDENRGQRKLRNLAEARRSRSRHDEIRGGIGLLHPMMEWRDIVGDFIPLVVCGGEPIIPVACEMNDLDVFAGEQRGGLEEELIDPSRTLAASRDEERLAIRCEME